MAAPLPEERRYKHITWRTTGQQSGWIIQFEGNTHGGFHANQEVAARALVKIMKLKNVKQLPRYGARVAGPTVAYQGVSFVAAGGYFVVNDPHVKGTFDTSAAGAAAIAAHYGTEPSRRRPRPQDIMRRMVCLRKVYVPKGKPRRHPGDVEASRSHVRRSRAMFSSEPTTQMASIHLKYGPWKDGLLLEWKTMRWPRVLRSASPQVDDPDVVQRAKKMKRLLSNTARRMARTQCPACWMSNHGRVVGRHSSPQMVLKHYGVLVADPRGTLSYGNADTTWRLAETDKEVAGCLEKLQRAIVGWAAVCQVCTAPAPRRYHNHCHHNYKCHNIKLYYCNSVRGSRRLPPPCSSEPPCE